MMKNDRFIIINKEKEGDKFNKYRKKKKEKEAKLSYE